MELFQPLVRVALWPDRVPDVDVRVREALRSTLSA
jgi:hypothetical protein